MIFASLCGLNARSNRPVVGTFNQEKALLGAFSMIVKTSWTSFYSSSALVEASGSITSALFPHGWRRTNDLSFVLFKLFQTLDNHSFGEWKVSSDCFEKYAS